MSIHYSYFVQIFLSKNYKKNYEFAYFLKVKIHNYVI